MKGGAAEPGARGGWWPAAAGAQGLLLETATSGPGAGGSPPRSSVHGPQAVPSKAPEDRRPCTKRDGSSLHLEAASGRSGSAPSPTRPVETHSPRSPALLAPPPPMGTAAPAMALEPSVHTHACDRRLDSRGPAVRAGGCARSHGGRAEAPPGAAGPRSWVQWARLNRLGGWRRNPGCSDEPEQGHRDARPITERGSHRQAHSFLYGNETQCCLRLKPLSEGNPVDGP